MTIHEELMESAWALLRAIDDAEPIGGIDADGKTHLAIYEKDIGTQADRLRDVLQRLESLARAAA
jgi:hypothetical protein